MNAAEFRADDQDWLGVDLAAGIYQADGKSFASADAMREVSLSGGGGPALTPAGAIKPFADQTPRIVPGVGLLLEPGSRNMLNNMNNAAPTTIGGWALLSNRPAGATLTVVDDMSALYDATDPVSGAYIFRDLIDAGLMNGKVVRAYNPSPDTVFAAPCFTASEGIYAFSAYVRCAGGSGFLSATGGIGGQTPDFSGTGWRRVGRTHSVESSAQIRLNVRPQSTVYIILAQLEPGNQITSPILIAGTAKSRRADALEVKAEHYLSRPHTILIDAEIARQDSVNRQIMTLFNPRKEEMIVLRHQDNTLSATQTGVRWRPRLPRVYGPGRILFAHRVSARGRALACGGFIASDPFRPAPPRLMSLVIGSARDGTNPVNGWVRSVRIRPEVDDDALKALTAPPPGSIAIDMGRYVSMTGDNDNDGLTPATAWRTLAKAADTSIVPIGSQIMIERGGTWAETLLMRDYCSFAPYGEGARPVVGFGVTNGIDENGAAAFRISGLHVFGAASRGFNQYGGGGAWLDDLEISYCGSANDANAIAVASRGNSRNAEIEITPGSHPPAGATITGVSANASLGGGVYTLTCSVAGAGTASRWQLRNPAGTIIGTVIGNTVYNNGSMRFTVTDAGADPVVGETFNLTVTAIHDVPFPTNALTEDFAITRCWMHHNMGRDAGDNIYCEAVQGVILVANNDLDLPSGAAADDMQTGRSTADYVANPAFVICTGNNMDMGGSDSTSLKGCAVINAGSALVEGNHFHGLNFCLNFDTSDIVVRWNDLKHARLRDYSSAIGISGAIDVRRVRIYENKIEDVNRAIAISANGTTTPPGEAPRQPWRVDVLIWGNVAVNCGALLFVDRPTSGRAWNNVAVNCNIMDDIRAGASPPPPGGAYDKFLRFNRVRAA